MNNCDEIVKLCSYYCRIFSIRCIRHCQFFESMEQHTKKIEKTILNYSIMTIPALILNSCIYFLPKIFTKSLFHFENQKILISLQTFLSNSYIHTTIGTIVGRVFWEIIYNKLDKYWQWGCANKVLSNSSLNSIINEMQTLCCSNCSCFLPNILIKLLVTDHHRYHIWECILIEYIQETAELLKIWYNSQSRYRIVLSEGLPKNLVEYFLSKIFCD